MLLIVNFVLVVTAVLLYREWKNVDKLSKEIAELITELEMSNIDLEGEKIFSSLYLKFLKDGQEREFALIEELEKLKNKDVKKKEAKNTKTKSKGRGR